ncbi:hypothetical protein QBC35DRAFT_395430 [Podospora australis]|uniref:RBR-type E3 ubiquitin transferase n=1 Tax=Podospora australis TaxID=1536484 RepID=A0AAN6WJC4_9PEZI|nr:hypothetical protein QBC35DRAFT_395430 [Podospora australis]
MKQQLQDCIICLTPFRPYLLDTFAPLSLPCGHAHCPSCLVRGFITATKTLPFQPALCCSPQAILPPAAFRPFFPSIQVADYRAKLSEYLSPSKFYCHHPTCSAFIPPILRSRGKQAKCRVCSRKTCVACRGRAHMGACPDEALAQEARAKRIKQQEKATRALLHTMRWKPCPRCRRVVEKIDGCDHISCLCGCHWCYRCGKELSEAHGDCSM